MAFPTVVTSGRIGYNNDGNSFGSTAFPAPYAAGNVDDLIIIIARVSKNIVGGIVRYMTTPAGWTRVAEVIQKGTDDEWAGAIFAIKASSTDGGTVDITVDGTGRRASVSYRVQNWHGTIADGVAGVFSTTNSKTAMPTLSPGWGTEDILWIGGITQLGTRDPDRSAPLNYSNHTDSEDDFLTNTGSDNYSRVSAAERALSASSETQGEWTDGFNQTDYRNFMLAVRPVAVNPGITITGIKEPNEANTLVASVDFPRVKVWNGTDDTGAEDDLFGDYEIYYPITNGTLEVPLAGRSIDDVVTVEVMWTVGTERKLFITETTVVDIGSGG